MDMSDDEETDKQSMLEDLQLAAELGKTLLERNKELENCLKQHQNVFEDQAQEIEYLTKQTAALREVNDSRLRIYEQLEVSIQDLERTNQRLALDNSADKKHIKSLCLSIDSLEARCEELQRALDEVSVQRDSQRRLQQNEQAISAEISPLPSGTSCTSTATETVSRLVQIQGPRSSLDDGEVLRLLAQVQELRSQRSKEQRKVTELEEQLAALLQENLGLEEQLALLQQKEEDMKSLQEEISTLEEVRQGHLCGRCLRTVDTRDQDELSLVMDHEEEDDISVVNSVTSETHCSTVMLHIENSAIHDHQTNPYRILVEKYEALLEMQRHPTSNRQPVVSNNNCLSLQEELQLSGDFNSFLSKDDAGSDHEGTESNEIFRKGSNNGKARQQNGGVAEKAFSTTPTDFSEAETSSSGFSDETSNKATQTEGHLPPGSLLCSIADGDDCRFSIYDDASPIESRFRKTPEYRQLFREIFGVLKRAAEAKDEGEELPLLEDLTPVAEAPKVPPSTPAQEEIPISFPKHEHAVTIYEENKNADNSKLKYNNPIEETAHSSLVDKMAEKFPYSQSDSIPMKALTKEVVSVLENPDKEDADSKIKLPPKEDYLEYLSIGVGVKKKSGGRRNSPMKNMKTSVAERVEQLESLPTTGGGVGTSYASRVSNNRRRKESRSSFSQPPSPFGVWGKKEGPAMPSQKQEFPRQASYDRSWDYQPYVSSASQEVAKLKRLEKSYAEVLRLGPQKSNRSAGMVNNHRK